MSWGDRFNKAYDAATDTDKAAANAILSSARAATAAALQTLGEVANIAGSLVVVASSTVFRVVSAPYRYAKQVFSPTATPADTVVVQCPYQTRDVFNNEYRKTLVDSSFAGADSPALRQAMVELAKPTPANVDSLLQSIATERGRPLDQIRDEYVIYREQQMQVKDKIVHSNGKLEPLDELLPEQADFTASTWQLRYGKVVGDRLGIDPVFGAMLNPTGGLVGPGNKGKAPDAWYMPKPIAYHGAYHDAMGYLYNYHGDGPGYNYMQSPVGLPTGKPLAGQATGVAQWTLNTTP